MTNRKSWIGCAILTGIAYSVIGIAFPNPDTANLQTQFLWRLAAWIVSAAMFAFHIGYEHFRLRNSPLSIALHTTSAVALGAFLLAVSATIHAVTVVSHVPFSRYLLALVLWPIFTAVPAFLVSLILATILARLPRKRLPE